MSTSEPESKEDLQKRKEATEQHLYDLTSAYHKNNDTVDVRIGQHGYAALDGSHIGIPFSYGAGLNGPQRLRLQADTTAHEVYHINYTDLEAKKRFSEKNDVAPQTAGMVYNIVEDHYIDTRRLIDFPGMRKSLAHKLDVQIEKVDNPKFYPLNKQPNMTRALVNGLLQVSSLGFAFGLDKCDDDVQDFVTWARSKVKTVRGMDDQDDREALSQEIFDTLMGYLPDPEAAEDYIEQEEFFKMEIPDDVELRPMTPEEQERFDQMKQDMPKVTVMMQQQGDEGDEGEQGDEGDEQAAGGSAGDESEESDEGDDGDQQGAGGAGDQQGEEQDGDEQEGGAGGDGDDETGDESGDEEGAGGAGSEGDEEGEDAGESGAGGSEGDESDEGDESGAGGAGSEGDEQGDGDDAGAGGDEGDEGDESGAGGEGDGDGDEGESGDDAGSEGDGEGDGDGNTGDSEDVPGGSGGDSQGGDDEEYSDERHGQNGVSGDELARERDKMLQLEKKGSAKDWYGVNDNEDASNVESRFVRRWQKIKIAETADEDSVPARENERDERMQQNVAGAGCDHQQIKDEVMHGRLKDDIEEAFKKLKTRDHYIERDTGERLNRRGVVRNRAGKVQMEPNYLHKQRAEKGDRAIGVALDMSNSMNEFEAKVALGALYHATHIIGDTITISSYFTQGGSFSSVGEIHTPLITGPDEEFKWQHLDSMQSDGWTPTASGVMDAKNLLKKAPRPEKVLIVITDGLPNVTPDGTKNNNKGLDAAASAVQQARHEGQKVIGLGVGDGIDEGNMEAMFGRDGFVMADMSDLADKLLKVYKKQMKVQV